MPPRLTFAARGVGVVGVKLNAQAKLIRKKYTRISKDVGCDGVKLYTAWLKIGCQWFCVTREACDRKEDAEWFRDLLAYALAVMVRELKKK